MSYPIEDRLNFLYGCLAWALPGSESHTRITERIKELEEKQNEKD